MENKCSNAKFNFFNIVLEKQRYYLLLPVQYKKCLFIGYLFYVILNSFLFTFANSQNKTSAANTTNTTGANASQQNKTSENETTPSVVITPNITANQTWKMTHSDFNPNIYFNGNYTKRNAYLIPDISLAENKTCFKAILPVIGLLSDYEQALLVKAALENEDSSRCIQCDIYSLDLMSAIKKELATTVKLFNIQSFSKRDPLRCMLDLALLNEKYVYENLGLAFDESHFANNSAQSSNKKDNVGNLIENNPAMVEALKNKSKNISTSGTNSNNSLEFVLRNMPNKTKTSLKAFLSPNTTEPTLTQLQKEISDFVYYQVISNQCAAEFLYDLELLLASRRRFFCAKINDMKQMGIQDNQGNIVAFKWTFEEAERITQLFNKLAGCKLIENLIYPQIFNKAYGIIAKTKACRAELEFAINQTQNAAETSTANKTGNNSTGRGLYFNDFESLVRTSKEFIFYCLNKLFNKFLCFFQIHVKGNITN